MTDEVRKGVLVIWYVAECSLYCLECANSGPGMCDPSECEAGTAYDPDSFTCKSKLI